MGLAVMVLLVLSVKVFIVPQKLIEWEACIYTYIYICLVEEVPANWRSSIAGAPALEMCNYGRCASSGNGKREFRCLNKQ